MTFTTTITSKGQITLPVAYRKAHNIKAGQKIFMDIQGDKLVVASPVDIEAVRARNLRHVQKLGIPPITDEDIDSGMARAAVERHKRSQGN